MDLSENLNKAASFTGKLFNDIGNLILLIVLNIIPIVNLIVVGYMARIVRENPEEPPKLSDYGKLFVDGLLVAVAGIIYALIPIIIMMIGVFSSAPFYGMMYRWGAPPLLIAGPFIAVGLILLFLFMIIGVISIGNMMRTGDFSKAFAFSENWGLIQKLGFGSYLIWLIVIYVILLIVGAMGSLIPWVGGAIFGTFFIVFFGKSLALVLDEASGRS